MQNQKQYKLELDTQGTQLLQAMIQEFPLGKVNVSEASVAANHAQQILNLIGQNMKEVVQEASPVLEKVEDKPVKK